MFLMAVSLGEAFNGLVLSALRLYPLDGLEGTYIKSLWVKFFAIGGFKSVFYCLQMINARFLQFIM